jgi:hypothetical protein
MCSNFILFLSDLKRKCLFLTQTKFDLFLVEGVIINNRRPVENHRPVASYCQTLSHNVVSSTSRHERGSNSQNYW